MPYEPTQLCSCSPCCSRVSDRLYPQIHQIRHHRPQRQRPPGSPAQPRSLHRRPRNGPQQHRRLQLRRRHRRSQRSRRLRPQLLQRPQVGSRLPESLTHTRAPFHLAACSLENPEVYIHIHIHLHRLAMQHGRLELVLRTASTAFSIQPHPDPPHHPHVRWVPMLVHPQVDLHVARKLRPAAPLR